MNGVLKSGEGKGPPPTHPLFYSNGVPGNNCDDSKWESSSEYRELEVGSSNEINPNAIVPIDLECDMDCTRTTLNGDEVNILSSEPREEERTNDDGLQEENVKAKADRDSEEQFESLVSNKFALLAIEADDIAPRRQVIFAELPEDDLKDNPMDKDKQSMPIVTQKSQQTLPVLTRPPKIFVSDEIVNAASRSDWKWHGTPRPTKPTRSASLSDSSSRLYGETSNDVTPSKTDVSVFKTPKPKFSSASKIPILCSTPGCWKKRASPLSSKPSKL